MNAPDVYMDGMPRKNNIGLDNQTYKDLSDTNHPNDRQELNGFGAPVSRKARPPGAAVVDRLPDGASRPP